MIDHLHRVVELVQDGWSRLRMIVVGDVMLDKYIWGDAERISPEAPVPVIRAMRHTQAPGGAANVAMNLAGLGIHVVVAGLVGPDTDGAQLRSLLEGGGVEARLVEIPGAPTISKTRIIGGHQQMLRLDVENTKPPSSDSLQHLLSSLHGVIESVDAIVLSDYSKGVLTTAVCREIIERGRARSIPILAAPKGRDLERYAGATAICPNLRELSVAINEPQTDVRALLRAAQARIGNLGLDYLVVTMGEMGIAVVSEDSIVQKAARARQVFDVSGAGDTVLATLAAAITSGLDIETSTELANLAAGVVVGSVGTVPIRRHQLLAELSAGLAVRTHSKILDRRQLVAQIAAWRSNGDSIVFTNGCFDLLHLGHLTLLEAARREGSRLVVAINSNDSVTRLKGQGRPIVGEVERARILAAMATVDAVTLFHEDTPLQCILEVRPDVIVKGGEYAESDVVGNAEIWSWKGRVKVVPMIAGFSTTSLIAKLARDVHIEKAQ